MNEPQPHDWACIHTQRSKKDPGGSRRDGMVVSSRTFRCKGCGRKITVHGDRATVLPEDHVRHDRQGLIVPLDCDEALVERIMAS